MPTKKSPPAPRAKDDAETSPEPSQEVAPEETPEEAPEETPEETPEEGKGSEEVKMAPVLHSTPHDDLNPAFRLDAN